MQQKPVILFVDDEKQVLHGLRNALYRMRRSWNMMFAESGSKALDILAQNEVDVIVSDVKMPEMNGRELINQVRQRYPGIIRLFLSGQTDQEEFHQYLGPVHGFIDKPCDVKVLQSTIEHLLLAREKIENHALRQYILKLTSLACHSSSYTNLMNELNSPDGTVQRIAQIVTSDSALSANVLHFVNSAYVGCTAPIVDIRKAVKMLGFQTIKGMALSTQVFRCLNTDSKGLSGFNVEMSQEMAVSSCARMIAQSLNFNEEQTGSVVLVSLLGHIGCWLFNEVFPDEMRRLKSSSVERLDQLCPLEEKIVGVTHPQAASWLMNFWGSSSVVVEALACQYQPANCSEESGKIALVVQIARALYRWHSNKRIGTCDDLLTENNICREFARKYISQEQLENWMVLKEHEMI